MCQGGSVEQPPGEASMGQASTIGLDVAKWVFQAHGADATGRVVFRKRLVRAKVLEFFAGQPPCLVALEACGGAHYWARGINKLGHPARVGPPAYRKAQNGRGAGRGRGESSGGALFFKKKKTTLCNQA